ncbi:MAG: UbiH/UbiF/VisC/COQ6 family ubiquinone biosynthesis hydroxylase [Proteobacteria bacterium]|nr:UbiH/UbiF/VisC/COQ6 family ubiquinone biosynthesis hydroxylase [Pseudomonadota bacterium]
MRLAQDTDILQYEVVIVGAGIVGLSCALALAKCGFSIAIIEANQPVTSAPSQAVPFDNKVVAITRASEYFFDYLGVWSTIKSSRLAPYQHMKVWDSVMDGVIAFSAVDYLEDNLGYIIEQQVIISALWQALQKWQIKVLAGRRVEKNHYEAQLNTLILSDETIIQTPLVIAADGANSSIRQQRGIPSTGWEYHQSALVATVQGTKSHDFTAYQRFAPDGPLALLPLASLFQSSIVWTTSLDNANKLSTIDPTEFAQILTRESDAVMGEMTLVGQRFLFPLKTHHAKQYVLCGCVLVGDAAHTIHPLAGLGVNLGLLDAASLIEIIQEHKHRLGDLALLKRYERQRKMYNQMMIWAMELFKQGFGAKSPTMQRIRNIGLNWVNKNQSFKHFFVKMALGTMGPIPYLARKNKERMHHEKDTAIR